MNAPAKIEAETLLGALAKVLPELEAAKKNAANPAFKQNGKTSKYADLGSVLEAIRPIADHGLWFRQVAHESEAGVCVETFYIGHGEELSAGRMFVPADRANAQGYGSAQTYARRYGLQLAFGLATEDDDGNAATAAPRSLAKEAPRTGPAEGQSRKGELSPGGSTPDSRWAELVQLIEATNTNVGKLLQFYNAPDLDALTAAQADHAKKALKTKLAEMAAAAPNKQNFGELLDDEIPEFAGAPS